jgi:putative ABC transport system ATP-binding protein
MYNFSGKKLYKPFSNDISSGDFVHFLKRILAADKPIFTAAIVYGIAISILSLATPVSVQLLINSVSFTAMLQPILVLGMILLLLVSLYGLASVLQFKITEIFQARFFARMGCEISMSILNADHKAFEESNRTEMVNRFFETSSIQKTIPALLSKTFTTLLQSFAGLVLVACYHPFFLVFTFGIPLAIWTIWKIFSEQAIIHSFSESRKKYDLAGWIEDLAGNHLLFKSRVGREYAKFKINYITGLYLEERKIHFKNLFSQVVLLFVLYALATSLLLTLGGWLVLENQLSLGQLVASELVISTMLYKIANLGRDFESFYDLITSSEKLSQFQNIPSENCSGILLQGKIEEIKFDKALCNYGNNSYCFDLSFEKAKNYLLFTNGYSTKKVIIDALLGIREISSGTLQINGTDLGNIDKYDLRSRIVLIDNSPLIEGTIKEYLTFNQKNIPDSYVRVILENVGLSRAILAQKEGLDSRIIPSGWPFSESEKILLKVARVLIHKPEIIIADEVLDMLGPQIRKKVLSHLTKANEATFLYFSHRTDDLEKFDEGILIEKTFSKKVEEAEDINEFQRGSDE